jgi:hypothetical protein
MNRAQQKKIYKENENKEVLFLIRIEKERQSIKMKEKRQRDNKTLVWYLNTKGCGGYTVGRHR